MTTSTQSSPSVSPAWRWAYQLLCLVFLLTAALNMLRVRGGFFTNHCADLVVPALIYVTARRYPVLTRRGKTPLMRRLVGSTAEIAALSIFGASAASEISQLYWPDGFFSGTFDPLDIVAYGLAVGLCYLADKRSAPPVQAPLESASSPTA